MGNDPSLCALPISQEEANGNMEVGSVDDLELRELAQAVIEPLKSGLHSFNNVSDMLLSVNADIVLPGCQTFDDIRQEIENMKLQMEKTDQIVRKELERLDGETERLTAVQSNLVNQRKQKEGELKTLETQLEGYRSNLNNYSAALNTARGTLRSAEDTLNTQRRKREEAERRRNAGIGLMFIPIVGLIAGAAMVGTGQVDMNQATEAANWARSEVHNCQSQVNSYSAKVSEFYSKIQSSEYQIKQVDYNIRQTDIKLRAVSVKREVVADVQGKVRGAVHQMGLLSGVGSAAELQTRRLILLEPVMKVMEEMTTVLGKITGEDLLHTEGIQSLMCDMKKNQDKLKQLADTKDTGLDDEYC